MKKKQFQEKRAAVFPTELREKHTGASGLNSSCGFTQLLQRKPFRAFLGMASMLHPDTPAKCCSYCGGRDHDFEECPKRKADAENEEVAREQDPTIGIQTTGSGKAVAGQIGSAG